VSGGVYLCVCGGGRKRVSGGVYMCVRGGADLGLRLDNGALCSDCDLAAEDVEVIVSKKAGEKSKE